MRTNVASLRRGQILLGYFVITNNYFPLILLPVLGFVHGSMLSAWMLCFTSVSLVCLPLCLHDNIKIIAYFFKFDTLSVFSNVCVCNVHFKCQMQMEIEFEMQSKGQK